MTTKRGWICEDCGRRVYAARQTLTGWQCVRCSLDTPPADAARTATTQGPA